MISRHWKGIAKQNRADDYVDHLKNDTFPKLSKISGFIKASILARRIEQGTEFLIITDWVSIEAIRAFAGERTDEAVVPPLVQDMMIEYDGKAIHYEVITNFTVQ